MLPPRLAIVILTWNGRHHTLACLETLRDAIGPEDAVLVVDNGSRDGTEDAVRTLHPWAEFVQNGVNLGYAGGNNSGLRRALDRGFRWVMLLNNDTLVPRGAISALLAHAEATPAAGAFQPLLVSAADVLKIDSAGHRLFHCPGVVDDLMGRSVADAPREPVSIFGACGAAALLRADALRATGLLDEDFFVLGEDVDLMFRIRLAGYDVQLVPSVRVGHARGISGVTQSPAAARNREFWLQRNMIAAALRYWPSRDLLRASPILAYRVLDALRLSLVMPGQRCLPLWWRSATLRRERRSKMRELGLDRWFGVTLSTTNPARAASPASPARRPPCSSGADPA